MTSDSALPTPLPDVSESLPEEKRNLQVHLKSEDGTLLLILPTEAETHATISWTDLWEQLKHRLNAASAFGNPRWAFISWLKTDFWMDASYRRSLMP